MTAPDTDAFLDGRVRLQQSPDGYRAGMDAVLLAACLPDQPDQHLVELGCGPGAALLCAAARLETGRFVGVEIDPEAARLARENVATNGLAGRVQIREGDVATLEADASAHQVFFNPPFFDDPAQLRTPKPPKERAWLSGDTPLPAWIDAAARLLRPKGRLTLVHRADKLDALLSALAPRFGSVLIKPVRPHIDRDAKRILVTARLAGRAPLRLLPDLVLHDDGPDPHTVQADAILRGRAVIEMD